VMRQNHQNLITIKEEDDVIMEIKEREEIEKELEDFMFD